MEATKGLLEIELVLVAVSDTVEALVRRASASPATRALGVVDAAGVLVGVVSVDVLVAAVVGRVAPGALLAEVRDVDGMEAFDRYVEARTAGDLMAPPAALPADATIAEAFHLMRDHHSPGAYVVDAAGRPIAYADGLGLAAAVTGTG
jgi:CBS domain-containing protein